MNPSQWVDVAFKVFNREQRQKEDAKRNATFWAAALDSRKVSNPEREVTIGEGTMCCHKEDEHWKIDCLD